MDAPPHYRRFSSRPGPAPESGELPPYTRRNTLVQPLPLASRELTEHVFHLADSKSRPWASLKLYSSAKSSKSLPTYFEKENINGTLELTADKGDSIQSITAVITGSVITGSAAQESTAFLKQSFPIWSKSMDVPRMASSSEGAAGPKLIGNCVWHLSLPMPRTIDVSTSRGESQSCRLPETFLERHTRASVQYDFSILVCRGKLRPNSQIKTAFGYVPSTRPDPPSLLRQLAYQQAAPLPGPEADPEGWKTFRPVPVRGVMFKARRVEAGCTLSLANPLCYTRGTVIPCTLKLECRDPQFLDMIATPSSIKVSLTRRVRFFNHAYSDRQDIASNDTAEVMASAMWWPSLNGRSDQYTRHLEGEIKLPKDLRPTSAVGKFSISYAVVVSSFDATHFVSDSPFLLSEPVEIASMHAKGPRPLVYSPPAYDPSLKHPDNDSYAYMHDMHSMYSI